VFQLTPRERITRAIVLLQEEEPFFSYIATYLKFRENKKIPTMGVDRYGNVPYNPDFVKKLGDIELQFVIKHEILHLILEHLLRRQGREPVVWNIAGDYVVNTMLYESGSPVPDFAIQPLETFRGKVVEAVYDYLMKNAKKIHIPVSGSGGDGKGDREGKGILQKQFDTHNDKKEGFYGEEGEDNEGKKDEKGSGGNEEPFKHPETDIGEFWKDITIKAATFAKVQGKLPAGLQKLIDKILPSKLGWKQMLWRYITKEIPKDYTWRRPHKRSQTLGTYFPSVLKEKIDIVIAVDTSGSISDEDYSQFMGEIRRIFDIHRDTLRGTYIECDASIKMAEPLEKVSRKRVFKRTGYGGTDFRPVFEWIREHKKRAKLLIYFTDGYGDFPERRGRHETLWILTPDGKAEEEVPFGRTTRIRKEE